MNAYLTGHHQYCRNQKERVSMVTHKSGQKECWILVGQRISQLFSKGGCFEIRLDI